jgi:hypothetical protein
MEAACSIIRSAESQLWGVLTGFEQENHMSRLYMRLRKSMAQTKLADGGEVKPGTDNS